MRTIALAAVKLAHEAGGATRRRGRDPRLLAQGRPQARPARAKRSTAASDPARRAARRRPAIWRRRSAPGSSTSGSAARVASAPAISSGDRQREQASAAARSGRSRSPSSSRSSGVPEARVDDVIASLRGTTAEGQEAQRQALHRLSRRPSPARRQTTSPSTTSSVGRSPARAQPRPMLMVCMDMSDHGVDPCRRASDEPGRGLRRVALPLPGVPMVHATSASASVGGVETWPAPCRRPPIGAAADDPVEPELVGRPDPHPRPRSAHATRRAWPAARP